MAHEELRKQYEEDRKKYGADAFKLWEYKYSCDKHFSPLNNTPAWEDIVEYRRKEPPFQPEYFSGLNWREAEKLVEEEVEASCDAEEWDLIQLDGFSRTTNNRFRSTNDRVYTYIRTCPETYQDQHPTITIGDVELPRPEVAAPAMRQKYWCWSPYSICMRNWNGTLIDEDHLKAWHIHLTEDRAQAWADWWQDAVMAAVNK